MASALSLQISITIRSSCSSSAPHKEPTLFLAHHGIRHNLVWPRHSSSSSSRSVLTCARRRSKPNYPITKKNKQNLPRNTVGKEDDLHEDAFEALFRQLEEDLKNDDPSLIDDDEEISEEDLAMLEHELEEALGDDELLKVFTSIADESEMEVEKEDVDNEKDEKEEDAYDDEEEDEEQKPVELKNWQLKRLAYALKNGRRKTSIKNLAAEVCLDRAIVLELLRDPPPNLLLMSAALPDKPPTTTILEPKTRKVETGNLVTAVDAKKDEAKAKSPVHVMQNNWSSQKRIKKVQVETLERVYRRTKRPTNAMISNIVHVTNLPRKRVVKWFEDKRTEDEVPDRRLPYQRSTPETVFTS